MRASSLFAARGLRRDSASRIGASTCELRTESSHPASRKEEGSRPKAAPDPSQGSVSACARWRIPVVVGYAAARFWGDEAGCGARHVDPRPSGIDLRARRKAIAGFRCGNCGKQFNERSAGLLNRAQYPSDVIALVVLWRLRYQLSLRDVAEMFLICGLVFSDEAVRDWEAKLTPALAENLRRRRKGKVGRSWYVDETYIRVRGGWRYLYRAIDRAGAPVDVMLSEHRDLAAAQAFFRSAKAVTGETRIGSPRTATMPIPEQSGPSSAAMCGIAQVAI
jgi:DDE domain